MNHLPNSTFVSGLDGLFNSHLNSCYVLKIAIPTVMIMIMIINNNIDPVGELNIPLTTTNGKLKGNQILKES